MVRRKYGGVDDSSSPEVEEQLDLMAEAANEMAGGAPKRKSRFEEAEPEPEPVVENNGDQGMRVDTDGAAPARAYNPFDNVPTPAAPAPSVAPAPKRARIVRAGITSLLKKIEGDANATTDAAEQIVVDGLGIAYKNSGKAALSMITTGLALNPKLIVVVMNIARSVVRNIPTSSWSTLLSNYSSVIPTAVGATYDAASFATTPQGALLVGSILLNAAARQAKKPVFTYVKGLASATAPKVIEDIKGELTRVANISPAVALNADIRTRLANREIQKDVALYLNQFAKAKLAEGRVPTVPFAPVAPVKYESVTGPTRAQITGPYEVFPPPPKKGSRRKTKKRVTKKRKTTRRH